MSRRTLLTALGLGCIALLDAILVGFSVQHVSAPASAHGQATTVRDTVLGPNPDAEPVPSTAPSPTPAEPTVVDRLALIDAVAPTVAVRASTMATCSGPPAAAQVTTNGGATWTTMPLPAPYLLRLHTVAGTKAWVVAARADCKPVFFRTDDGGQTWVPAASTTGAWHRLPGTALHAPSASVTPPCGAGSAPDALSPLTATTAYVGCRNAGGTLVTLLETTTGGPSWTNIPLPPVEGPASMAWPSAGTGFVVGTSSNCRDGFEVVRSGSNGASWSVAACVKAPGAGAVFGISFADAQDGLLTALAPDGGWSTWASHDAGSTWTQVSG